MVLAAFPAPLRTTDREAGALVGGLAVLGGEEVGVEVAMFAEVGGVDEETLAAALHIEGDPGHRGVGDGFEGVADLAVDAFDVAEEVEVDLAVVKGGDEVGELAGAGDGAGGSAGRPGLRGVRRGAVIALAKPYL
jgi:hypothetical protein